MIRLLVLALFASIPMLAQQAAPPADVIDAKALRAMGDQLLAKAKAAPSGIAYKVLIDRHGDNEQYTLRIKSGQGEWHHDYIDVCYIIQGRAELVTGGRIINGKESMPGEIRGDGVEGGKRQAVGPGDVVRIGAQTPHQWLVPAGGELLYFTVKIKQ